MAVRRGGSCRPAVDAFVAAIRDAGVQLIGLNFAAGDMPGGDRGLVSWPARSDEFRDNVDVTVGYRRAARVRGVQRALRQPGGRRADPRQQDDLAVENLAVAAQAAGRIGGIVLVEPVSGAPRYPLKTAADVVGVIDRVQRATGAENLRLLCDLYHLAVNGDDVDAAIAQHADRVGHVQIADAPGRNEPGTGELPLDRGSSELAQAGYDGWVAWSTSPAQPLWTASAGCPSRRAAPTG